MCECNGESCHEASVFVKNGRNLNKGKNNQFTVSKIEYPINREPKGSNCPSKILVSHSNDVEVLTVCQVADGAVRTSISRATVEELDDSDKYELKIQNKL